MTALGLQRSPQDFLAGVTQVFDFVAVGKNFLGEARFVAFQRRWWRRLLCSHYFPPTNKTGVVDGVCSIRQTELNEIASVAGNKTLLLQRTVAKHVFLLVQTVRSFSSYSRKTHCVTVTANDAALHRRVAVYRQGKAEQRTLPGFQEL